MRHLCAGLFVAGLAIGCEALRPAVQEPNPPAPFPSGKGANSGHTSLTSADAQEAMRAFTPFPEGKGAGGLGSSPVDILRAAAQRPSIPTASQVAPEDALLLVAKCLERGDHRGAATHLETYVRAHPDQPLFRWQLAELCAQCERSADARFHYERFVADAEGVAALGPHVVAGHIKLMEMAQRSGDKFAELYHRGAGLLLLVKSQDAAPDRDATFCEEMLCKALRALTDAKELKPADEPVRLRLAEVLDRAGSRRAANAERAGVAGRGWKLEE